MIVFDTPGWHGQIKILAVEDEEVEDSFYFDSGVQNAYAQAAALLAWINHASRPWHGITAGGVTMAAVEDDARPVFTFDTLGGTLTPQVYGDAWEERVGIRLEGEDQIGITRGGCGASVASLGWEQRVAGDGGRSRRASWQFGHGLHAHRRPEVRIPMNLDQAGAFHESIRLATQPRRAYIYDELDDVWRRVTVGRHTLEHLGDDYRRVIATLDVAGGA